MERKTIKTFIGLGIIASIIAIVFPLATFFANKVPSPIYIENEDDFSKINNNLSGYYILKGAVKFTKPVKPIGDKDHPFTGRFDCASSISGFSLNNVVIDLNNLDLEKYTIENKIYIGLFAFNEGTIIHSVFNDIKFQNFDYDGNNDLYIGGLTGLNKGKITSNKIYQISNISFSSQKNIVFGGCAGLNVGEIRRNSYTKHFECYVSCNTFSIGEFAGECNENSVIEMCAAGSNIQIYNSDSLHANQINVGVACGIFGGGLIQNNMFNNSNINLMNNNICTTNCGGIVGLVSGSNKALIKDCYFNAVINSNGLNLQNNSFVCGNVLSENLILENLLIGGALSSHNISSGIVNFFDATVKSTESIKNCYLLDNARVPDSCLKNIKNTINIRDVTLRTMNWSDAIWNISEGKISFKALYNEE